jgi:hypothetical protein
MKIASVNNEVINSNNEMISSICAVTTNLGAKVALIFSSIWSWICGAALTITSYFLPIKAIIILTFIVVAIDFILGVYNHRKTLQSAKFRESLLKFLIYLLLISLSFSIENAIGIAFLYKIIFAVAALTELYSICGNLLVIAPNIPILKLFKNILATEIAKKMEISREDEKRVTDILDNKDNNKTKNNENK